MGSADWCLLDKSHLLNDKFSLHASLENNVKEVHFFARELCLKGRDLPEDVVQRCDTLRKSEGSHGNVASFLGLIVEEHVQPLPYFAAKIFEEYAEGELMLQSCVLLYSNSYYTALCALFPPFLSPW